MKIEPIQITLLLAWLYILPRSASDVLFGCNFHKENWLGGYASQGRRLYRLGHISFAGMGFVNLLFYFTAAILRFALRRLISPRADVRALKSGPPSLTVQTDEH